MTDSERFTCELPPDFLPDSCVLREEAVLADIREPVDLFPERVFPLLVSSAPSPVVRRSKTIVNSSSNGTASSSSSLGNISPRELSESVV